MLLRRLRKGTGQEDSAGVPAPPLTHQKDHILAAFQLGLHLLEVVLSINLLLINFEDNITAAKTNVLAKGARLDILHDHPFPSGNAQAVSNVGRHAADAEAQLALLWLFLLASALFLARTGCKQLGAVGDGQGSFT